MIQHHDWSLEELENMLPYERQIYVMLLQEWIKEENQKTADANRKMKG